MRTSAPPTKALVSSARVSQPTTWLSSNTPATIHVGKDSQIPRIASLQVWKT